MGETTVIPNLQTLDAPLDRDTFMRTLIRELSGTLEDVVGLKDAAGFISVVGQAMGEQIDSNYKEALETPRLNREQVAEVLVERIEGDFYVIEQDDEKIVLGNRARLFGEKVLGRNSMCMMTSNVFGVIAANNLGFAKVELRETIATWPRACRVVVHLKQTSQSHACQGKEYFKE